MTFNKSTKSIFHFSSKIKAAFGLLKEKRLSFQDLLTANFIYKKSVLPSAIISIAFILLMSTNCFAANEWRKGTGENVILGTESASDIDTISYNNVVAPLDRLLSKYRKGVQISYASASTLTVGIGEITCSNAALTIRKFRANTSVVTVAWADANAAAETNSSTFYLFAVADADANTFTVEISTSSAAPGTGVYFQRLGSFYNDVSGNITSIVNDSFTGELGSWESKSTGTTYQATTDGFVTAYGTGGAATGISLTGYTDSSSTPTTIRVYQVIQSGLVNPDSPQAISFPVKKGDYWKVVIATGSATVYWISSD
jgi:hypothetical protein